MLTGYGELGRDVYSAVCITDSLFVLTRELSVMLTQFSFWSYAPAVSSSLSIILTHSNANFICCFLAIFTRTALHYNVCRWSDN